MKIFARRAVFFSGLMSLTFGFFPTHATDTNPPPRLTVELRDGSRVVGTSVEKNLNFHSALLGDLKLAVKNLRTIEWVATNSVKLRALNGDVLLGTFADGDLMLKTGFGKVTLASETIRKVFVSATEVSAPQREGLVGFWSGNGTAADSAGDNNGSLMGDAGFASGLLGQAFNFEAPGSWVKIPQISALNPGRQVTVELWMKADAANAMQNYQGLVTSDFYGVEISNGYGGNMGVNFFVSTTASQPPRRSSWSEPDFSGVTSVGNFTHVSDANGGGAAVSAGVWHHLAGTYDGSQLRLYVDGQLWGKPMFRPGVIAPMLPDSLVAIGSEDGRTTCPDCVSNRYFKGQISGVAIYKRALSPAEIREDYAVGKTD